MSLDTAMTTPRFGLESDLAVALDAARAGGIVAKSFFRGDFEVREKKPGDPVSDADIAVNQEIISIIRTSRPQDIIISEELPLPPQRINARRAWIIDPIDGTKSFIDGIAEFAISIALVCDQEPIAAAVYNPITDQLFDAVKGGGTRLNGENATTSETAALPAVVLGTSKTELRQQLWSHLFPEVTLKQVDAIAYKLALVATGELDAVIALRPKSDWDIAAGDLLVREAGGLMTDAGGTPHRYNEEDILHPNLVASGTLIHPTLLERLKPDHKRI
ncbi:MAG: 3'(2'),5'-bisphosphate nucleotidase CysQ [Alphaproteobacteria bacterium]